MWDEPAPSWIARLLPRIERICRFVRDPQQSSGIARSGRSSSALRLRPPHKIHRIQHSASSARAGRFQEQPWHRTGIRRRSFRDYLSNDGTSILKVPHRPITMRPNFHAVLIVEPRRRGDENPRCARRRLCTRIDLHTPSLNGQNRMFVCRRSRRILTKRRARTHHPSQSYQEFPHTQSVDHTRPTSPEQSGVYPSPIQCTILE